MTIPLFSICRIIKISVEKLITIREWEMEICSKRIFYTTCYFYTIQLHIDEIVSRSNYYIFSIFKNPQYNLLLNFLYFIRKWKMPLFMFTYLLELAIQLNGFREKMDALCQNQTIVIDLKNISRWMCEWTSLEYTLIQNVFANFLGTCNGWNVLSW